MGASDWWEDDFDQYPYEEWFYAYANVSEDNVETFVDGWYWFYRIPRTQDCGEQLAFYSETDVVVSSQIKYEAYIVYVITEPGDTPNWDGSTKKLVTETHTKTVKKWVPISYASTPCHNPTVAEVRVTTTVDDYVVYRTLWTERSQTIEMELAIRADRTLESSVETAIAKTGVLELSTVSAVQANLDLEFDMDAVIQGDADRLFLARAAVRTERTLEDLIVSAVATEFGDTVDVETAIQGNPFETVRIDAAILGETELEVTIRTTIVKDRTEAIMLELENTWPQEFYFVSIPNWRSRAKDYRTDSIG